jgi:hypothetical protein
VRFCEICVPSGLICLTERRIELPKPPGIAGLERVLKKGTRTNATVLAPSASELHVATTDDDDVANSGKDSSTASESCHTSEASESSLDSSTAPTSRPVPMLLSRSSLVERKLMMVVNPPVNVPIVSAMYAVF